MESRSNAVSKIAMASLSAMVAETATFPIDITKTRLQLHATSLSSTTRSLSAFQVAAGIVRDEGLIGMYKGLSPALIRHLIYTPIRTVGYEQLRRAFLTDGNQTLSLPSKALIGGFSGVIAQNEGQQQGDGQTRIDDGHHQWWILRHITFGLAAWEVSKAKVLIIWLHPALVDAENRIGHLSKDLRCSDN